MKYATLKKVQFALKQIGKCSAICAALIGFCILATPDFTLNNQIDVIALDLCVCGFSVAVLSLLLHELIKVGIETSAFDARLCDAESKCGCKGYPPYHLPNKPVLNNAGDALICSQCDSVYYYANHCTQCGGVQ